MTTLFSQEKKKPQRLLRSILIVAASLSAIFLSSCEEDEAVQCAITDFRTPFVGNYTCLMTHHYFDGNDSLLIWSTDTLSFEAPVSVTLEDDSALLIDLGSSSFIGTYQGDNKFICLDCPGPQNYAQFLEQDSIYVYKRSNILNRNHYYGVKNQ